RLHRSEPLRVLVPDVVPLLSQLAQSESYQSRFSFDCQQIRHIGAPRLMIIATFASSGILLVAPGNQTKFDPRALLLAAGRRRPLAGVSELQPFVGHAADSCAHQCAEKPVDEIENFSPTSEVFRKRNAPSINRAVTPALLVAAKEGGVGQPEPVNALFRVADEKTVSRGGVAA